MVRWFARHPTAANLLMISLLVIGAAALPGLTRETLPEFAPREVQVTVPYPGAASAEVEQALCLRLEDALDGLTGLRELTCEAAEGRATLVARMTDDGDFGRFLDDVKNDVDAIDSFPEQVERPVVEELGRNDPVVSLAITGPMSVPDLKLYAESLKTRLQSLPGVSQVAVSGFSDHQLRVEVPLALLHQFDLGVNDVASAVARQSVSLPAGTLETGARELLLRFDDERTTVQALESLVVIGGERGGVIRLGDIATVRDRFETDDDRVLFNGRRAAVLKVEKTGRQDAVEVLREVQAFVERERARAPPGVEFRLTDDVASVVLDRLSMLVHNGWQGLVLVFLTMWLFFQLRLAFWVTMGLPVSFLGGLFAMAMLGYSINMISMVALLIALGLMMDDAIVIAENVASRRQRGASPLEAAVEGTREVLPGVVSSFLTTVAVFAPLAFLSGEIGQVLRVMPVVLIAVLAVSLVEALWILPNHLGHALAARGRPQAALRRRFDAGLDRFRERVVGRAVDAVIRRRYLFAGAVAGLLVLSVGIVAAGVLGFQAFPDIEGDIVEARITLPQGTPRARTEAVVARVSAALAEADRALAPREPGGEGLVRNVAVYFGVNRDAGESGAHVATVKADLRSTEVRRASTDELTAHWRRAVGDVPDVVALAYRQPAIGPGGRDIDLRLEGEDLERVGAAAAMVTQWLTGYRGVVNVSHGLRPGKPELGLTLREEALGLGLDARSVADQLRAAFQGRVASEVQVGAEPYEVEVRLAAADRDGRDDLAAFRLIAPSGALVPLDAVVDIRESRGYARITRVDGRRSVSVQGDVDPRRANAVQVLADTRAQLLPRLADAFPDVRVVFEGQSASAGETGDSMRRGLLVGLVGIFVLLSLQFRSYLEPLAVMSAIPLAAVGVVGGHLLMGLDLSMPSVMGFVSLAGIVVNDSILLVAFLKRHLDAGVEVEDAARRASRERFRAVLLTSLTTIAGLLPLLAERSVQAQVLVPLVTSIAFGLLASTVLVLLVVPCLFAILHDLGLTRAAREDAGADAQPRDAPAAG